MFIMPFVITVPLFPQSVLLSLLIPFLFFSHTAPPSLSSFLPPPSPPDIQLWETFSIFASKHSSFSIKSMPYYKTVPYAPSTPSLPTPPHMCAVCSKRLGICFGCPQKHWVCRPCAESWYTSGTWKCRLCTGAVKAKPNHRY